MSITLQLFPLNVWHVDYVNVVVTNSGFVQKKTARSKQAENKISAAFHEKNI